MCGARAGEHTFAGRTLAEDLVGGVEVELQLEQPLQLAERVDPQIGSLRAIGELERFSGEALGAAEVVCPPGRGREAAERGRASFDVVRGQDCEGGLREANGLDRIAVPPERSHREAGQRAPLELGVAFGGRLKPDLLHLARDRPQVAELAGGVGCEVEPSRSGRKLERATGETSCLRERVGGVGAAPGCLECRRRLGGEGCRRRPVELGEQRACTVEVVRGHVDELDRDPRRERSVRLGSLGLRQRAVWRRLAPGRG